MSTVVVKCTHCGKSRTLAKIALKALEYIWCYKCLKMFKNKRR